MKILLGKLINRGSGGEGGGEEVLIRAGRKNKRGEGGGGCLFGIPKSSIKNRSP